MREVVSKATGTPPGEHPGRHARTTIRDRSGETRSPYAQETLSKLTAAATTAVTDSRPASIGYGEGTIHFNINRRQGDQRPRGRPPQPGRSVRSPGQGSAIRRRPESGADGCGDARGLPPLRLHLGRQVDAPVSQRLSQDERRLSRRGPAVRRDGLRRTDADSVSPGCSGDIRPNLPGHPYRCGDEADIRWIGRDLGCEVVRTADRTAIREEMARTAQGSIRSNVRPKS